MNAKDGGDAKAMIVVSLDTTLEGTHFALRSALQDCDKVAVEVGPQDVEQLATVSIVDQAGADGPRKRLLSAALVLPYSAFISMYQFGTLPQYLMDARAAIAGGVGCGTYCALRIIVHAPDMTRRTPQYREAACCAVVGAAPIQEVILSASANETAAHLKRVAQYWLTHAFRSQCEVKGIAPSCKHKAENDWHRAYELMLCEIPQISERRAKTVMSVFPTVRSLCEAIQQDPTLPALSNAVEYGETQRMGSGVVSAIVNAFTRSYDYAPLLEDEGPASTTNSPLTSPLLPAAVPLPTLTVAVATAAAAGETAVVAAGETAVAATDDNEPFTLVSSSTSSGECEPDTPFTF